jgi:hypothetical protein
VYPLADAKWLELPLAGITKVGEQVMSLVKFEANEEYVVAVGYAIEEKDAFTVSLGKVREVDSGKYDVVDDKPLPSALKPFKWQK